MRVACIVEGDTEYYCLPKLLGKLGHIVFTPLNIAGSSGEWESLFAKKILPRLKALALKNPDKILILLDREERPECPPDLAQRGLAIIEEQMRGWRGLCPISIIISDKYFECLLFADYAVVDALPILTAPVSPLFGTTTDGKNVMAILKTVLRPTAKYRETEHGPLIAKRMGLESQDVLARNRALRKLLAEVPREVPKLIGF